MKTATSSTVEITPEMAMQILQTNIRNRTMNKHLVLFYAEQMKKGLWKFNGESVIISDGNVLLDGQHRLAAIVKSKTTQTSIIVRNIDGAAFDTIDVGKNRTGGDMLSTLSVKNANKKNSYIVSYFQLLNKNTDIVNNSSGAGKLSKAETVREYTSNPDFWDNIDSIATRMYFKLRLLSNSSIGGYSAFLIKNKKHSEEKVMSFFNQLFFDTNIENSTIPLLREKLLKNITGQYKLTTKFKHALIVKTWNCYISGKELKVLHFNTEKEQLPEFI